MKSQLPKEKKLISVAAYNEKTSLHPVQFKNNIIRLICLLVFVLGCEACSTNNTACTTGDTDTNCKSTFWVDVKNPHFEFSDQQPVKLGQDFWLLKDDSIYAAWDEYTVFYKDIGSDCDPNQPSPFECRRCNLVIKVETDCRTGNFPSPQEYLNVFALDGFMPDSSPLPAVSVMNPDQVHMAKAELKPQRNSTLQLNKGLGANQTLATTKAFVIEGAGKQPATYELKPLVQTVTPDSVFYIVTAVPDNFSRNLRIGRIRILQGEPGAVGTPAKPSRVIFIPNYQEGADVNGLDSNRCYARYPSESPNEDGNIDLTGCNTCRAGDTGANCRIDNVDATPIFWTGDPELKPLTWVVEFKTSDGGVAPSLKEHEKLAIEFTIQAK